MLWTINRNCLTVRQMQQLDSAFCGAERACKGEPLGDRDRPGVTYLPPDAVSLRWRRLLHIDIDKSTRTYNGHAYMIRIFERFRSLFEQFRWLFENWVAQQRVKWFVITIEWRVPTTGDSETKTDKYKQIQASTRHSGFAALETAKMPPPLWQDATSY